MNYLFSTAYLPSIEYFYYLHKATSIYIEKYENYIKQSYRNRCYIYGPNGKLALTLPVNKTFGNKTPIKDIRLSYLQRWQSIHWRSIEAAYNSSPFFLYYKDDFFRFYNQKTEFLIDYNTGLTEVIMKSLGIKKDILFTESYNHSPTDKQDMRYRITPMEEAENKYPVYTQVFSNKHGFLPNLSIIDLLFNEGPSSLAYIEKCLFLPYK
jgi:hypothetical protein